MVHKLNKGKISMKSKEYVCQKRVIARPMSLGDYNEYRGWNIPANEDPCKKGYLVEYPDSPTTGMPKGHINYISWSPKEQFDNGYVPIENIGTISDGYHSFDELYEFRKAYNACLFNEWHEQGKYDVHKSLKHHDGELCFGGGWFVVVAITPFGQVTNHYKVEDWDLFKCESFDAAKHEFDGHNASDALSRLFLTARNNKAFS